MRSLTRPYHGSDRMTNRHTTISAEQYHRLQQTVLKEFMPRFAARAKVLFVRGPAKKPLVCQTEELEKVGLAADSRFKLPDMILYLPQKKWLYLIGIADAGNLITARRQRSFEQALSMSQARAVHVNVFAGFEEYSRHVGQIAWDSEVWIAETPEHMIHHNGDRFLGPHRK